MEGLISSIDDENVDFSLKAYCWQEYSIATCLVNIEHGLNPMKEQI